ncbi:MAG TPA: phosphotransferase [Streptosporangiaceae bacterium]|nr:phosphotransferase [Streptosporangiaceae bacterium]
MAIAPRFHRVAALQRPFVDREQILADFEAELARIGSGPRVFNVTGVGGIGKSRLLRELQHRASPQFRTATIDLQVPAVRRQDDALAVLRGQLGAQGASFDRFDIAFAVLWQRMHPHLQISEAQISFLEYSSILKDILDGVSGVPVFGTAVGLFKLLERSTTDIRRRYRIRHDATLQALDGLPNAELADAVTYLFAEDLRAASGDKKTVIIVDSYEALVPAPQYSGRVQLADTWLRDLVGQLDQALTVIASREPLHWEVYDPDWASAITTAPMDGLPMPARLELLEAGGITEPSEREHIATASAGLPFYLHLAVDTHQRAGRGTEGVLVSQDEILARFLQHVAPEEIRSLEILSPARMFDYEIFSRLAAAFQLLSHRLAWDSLTAYSFIYPAGDALRLHQLIRTAVQQRLPGPAAAQIHTLLTELWAERARHSTGTAAARACREAAYHGLRAGQTTAAELLGYADQAVRWGGQSAADGIADDLDEWLASQSTTGTGDAALVLQCLRAEGAVRLGDAASVADITGSLSPATLPTDTIVAARIAMAAAHGQRIAGQTRAALSIYRHVWEQGDGPPKLSAGLWASDLHMCQGRFRDSEELAAELEALTPAGETEFRGDIARLRHLTARFALDFGSAQHHLDTAETCYRRARSVLGLANAQTNRAELLAITTPNTGLSEAARAIEVQQEIGAYHELGKAYTALAIAHTKRGELDQADAALQSAFSALDQAGYRSGQARAHFYLAIVQVRRGQIDEAITSLHEAVAGLQAADVYPTLILCAAQVLQVIGVTDTEISSAARQAETDIQPLGSHEELHTRIAEFVAGLLDPGISRPVDLYREASARTDSAVGYYNYNVTLPAPTGLVVVRMPIPGSDTMDLAIWSEPSVLRAIRGRVRHAPRLLYANEMPTYQVHEFIDGTLLDTSAPRGTPIPAHVVRDVAELFGQLAAVPEQAVPPLPANWPDDGDTVAFAHRLSAVTEGVYARFQPEFGELFTRLGIPAGPLAGILARWSGLSSRPFHLLHTDVHRKNMITASGRTYFLDWELALWGDPVYDLAVHLHKMDYTPEEEQAMQNAWLDSVPSAASEGWKTDLGTYLAHERVKSAIVDTVRYTKIISTTPPGAEREATLARKLAAKLAAAQATGGTWAARTRLNDKDILTLIRDWAPNRTSQTLAE